MNRIFTLLLSAILVYHHSGKAQITKVQGPAGSGQYGGSITVLNNGNYVISDPLWDNGSLVDVGAVYLYNGANHAKISTLTGTKANDQVGSGGIEPLKSGSFLVLSPVWDNGSLASAGAVTWVNGSTGIEGNVTGSNSLVGSQAGDFVGLNGVVVLNNDNYLVLSPFWDNGLVRDAGAATWANGGTGLTGPVDVSNSLVGSHLNDHAGSEVLRLSNENYLVLSPHWNNGDLINAGSVAWGNGTTGTTGVLSASNSLTGSTSFDIVGLGSYISLLPNGNYIVKTPGWDNGGLVDAGAVTWGNGISGTSGLISPSNSLVGSHAYDLSESSLTILTNGSYLIRSPFWDNGAIIDAGAITWGNGTSATSGVISLSNSLVGSREHDLFESTTTVLSNGNYVVGSPNWDNGAITNAGAATWGSGTSGITGIISAANSLIGLNKDDQIGLSCTALTNGNYVVSSPNWTNPEFGRVGAATFADGLSGITGEISLSNSLVGSIFNDQVGFNVIPLDNGNYVVRSVSWHNGTGAATWGNGSTGVSGVVTSANSLVGSSTDDQIGNIGVLPLPNGNYVVCSSEWNDGFSTNVGAATWGSGMTGVSGEVNALNSLVGSHNDDRVGLFGIKALTNGNYVVKSAWWGNGIKFEVGAITWGNGITGVRGVVSSSNSLVGTQQQNRIGDQITALSNGNYLVSSMYWDNGPTDEAGAVTWGDGSKGVSGEISPLNSLVGRNNYDRIGGEVITLSGGNYILLNLFWRNGSAENAGAITWGSGGTGLSGTMTECNSFLGTKESGGLLGLYPRYNPVYDYVLISDAADNQYAIYKPQGLLGDHAIVTETLKDVPVLFSKDCKPFASLAPAGASPVTGSVTAKVYMQSEPLASGNQPYVRRHHDVTVSNHEGTATGKVTLYYLQGDFDNFNELRKSYPALPQGPDDTQGKSNLRVTQQHGSSDTGLPNSYKNWTGAGPAIVLLDPLDEDIVWNSVEKRWEVSFPVTGFSGFFAHTTLDEAALPVVLIDFGAREVERNAVLSWKTSSEVAASHFEVERSFDAKTFKTIGIIDATGTSITEQRYSFTDIGFGLFNKIVYYRLRLVDQDGSFSHSKTVNLTSADPQTANWIFPNPAQRDFPVTLQTNEKLSGFSFIDNTGKSIDVRSKVVSDKRVEFNLSGLITGVYMIKFTTNTGVHSKKIILE